MTQVLAEPVRISLEQKLSSVERELEQWRADSAEGKPLRKHHFQIARLGDALGAYTADVGAKLRDPNLGDSSVQTVELEILEIHRIWEFYRSKLVLRYFSWFRDYLDAADEFAWACYQPARDLVLPDIVPRERVKEPPLVYFNGGWSPLAMSRGAAYQVPAVAGGVLNSTRLGVFLADLPIPIIGVPWYQVRHFPDAVVIGHEVGHNVEHDMQLTATIQRLISDLALDGTRENAWVTWSGEVFGDVYAALATGPAFVSALEAFVESNPAALDSEAQGPAPQKLRPHPPVPLRMRVCYEALRQLGHDAISSAGLEGWLNRHPTDVMADFHGDVKRVVQALLDGPYPEFGSGQSLTSVLTFGPKTQTAAANNAELVNREREITAVDIRVLVAAGRLAFDARPADYTQPDESGKDGNDRLVERIVGLRDEEVRGGTNRPGDTASADALLGHSLLEQIRAAHEAHEA